MKVESASEWMINIKEINENETRKHLSIKMKTTRKNAYGKTEVERKKVNVDWENETYLMIPKRQREREKKMTTAIHNKNDEYSQLEKFTWAPQRTREKKNLQIKLVFVEFDW